MPKPVICRIDSFAYSTLGNKLATTVPFSQPLPPTVSLITNPRISPYIPDPVSRLLGDYWVIVRRTGRLLAAY